MSISIGAADEYYRDTLIFYMGSRDQNKGDAIWNRYIEARGFTAAPPATDKNKSDFRAFVSFYTSLGISPLNSNKNIPSVDGDFYNLYLKGFYGHLSDSMRKDIWNSFLKANPYAEDHQDDTTVRTLFANYIKNLQQESIELARGNSLTPQEELQRGAVYNTLGALQSYMDATQQLLSNQASILLLYANWQQEYTKMMQKIPTLTGGQPGHLSLGTKLNTTTNQLELTSADKYTFGYANITLQDVVNWGYKEACLHPGVKQTFGDPTKGMGAYSLTLNPPDLSGKQTVTIGFQSAQFPTPITAPVTIKDPSVIDPLTKQPLELDANQADQAIGTAFINLFKTIPNFIDVMSHPLTSDIRDWLIQQAIANQSAIPPYDNYPYAGKSITYKGASIAYDNYATEADPTKRFQITVENSKNLYIGLGTYYHYYTCYCTVTTTIGGVPQTPKVFQTTETLMNIPDSTINEKGTYAINLANDYIKEQLDAHLNLLSGPIAIPGYFLGTSADPTNTSYVAEITPSQSVNPTADLEQTAIQARGERQSVLTNYAQTIKGVRDLIGSLASRQQSSLNQAKESLKQQSDIFTSILESIDSIMKAICKK